MKVLLLGSGGREAAIAWKLFQSSRLTELYVTHQGLQQNNSKLFHAAINEKNQKEIIDFSQQKNIDLVIIGSEEFLAAGLVDALQAKNIKAFGPTQAAAQIEASKIFAKEFMLRYNIPTARFAKFNLLSDALPYIKSVNYPIVIKASGLAGGKGVFLPENLAEAEQIVQQLLHDKSLGAAGSEIIIEERLLGQEVSLLAFTDGITIKPLPLARDHKRLLDGDLGPNTGGMGAIAPVALPKGLTPDDLTATILKPVINNLRAENKNFVGVIYAGLMLTQDGPKVLEFNCRLGDPETQALMPLLDSDLLEIFVSCVEQKLDQCKINWKKANSACVILASAEYPAKSTVHKTISGLDNIEKNTFVFHAGSRFEKNQFLTNGGRVLAVTSLGDTLETALTQTYQQIKKINFDGMQYRKDIGKTKDLYAAAGVDITAGNRTVQLMTAAVKSTYGSEVLAGIGAFGGMFDAAALKTMNKPVLVASTDGIGTKVHLAAQFKRFHSLGFDIVNHSVNDILVQGAKPLFFLDYLAADKLDPEKMALIVTGMAEACRTVNCALLGGETAEMPGVYQKNTFDVAGTIVGIVEKDHALPQSNLQAGDVLLGIASSGPHTNGYSLIRKIFADVDLEKNIPELNNSLIDALLAPHRCYLPILQPILQHTQKPIKALVHITGGGFYENIPRVLPKHLSAIINLNSWPIPPLFQLIQQRGNVPMEQMYRVFNMGIGMIMITAKENVVLLQSLLQEKVFQIGELVLGNKEVVIN